MKKIRLSFDLDELKGLQSGLSWAESEGAEPDQDLVDKINKAIETLKLKASKGEKP